MWHRLHNLINDPDTGIFIAQMLVVIAFMLGICGVLIMLIKGGA